MRNKLQVRNVVGWRRAAIEEGLDKAVRSVARSSESVIRADKVKVTSHDVLAIREQVEARHAAGLTLTAAFAEVAVAFGLHPRTVSRYFYRENRKQ